MLADRARFAAGASLSSIYSVPQGLIFMFNDVAGNIPAGFRRFDEMDDRHPVGAGSTYAAKSTGGAQGSILRSSAESGSHSGTTRTMLVSEGATVVNFSASGGANGAHSHRITAKYDREYQALVFVKATAPHIQFPANSIILGKAGVTPVAGLTICFDDEYILRGAEVEATGWGITSKACSYDGLHIHGLGQFYDSTSPLYYWTLNAYSGTHNHPVIMSISDEELKRTLLTAWTGAGAFDVDAGVIAMWEGAMPPPGWYLCDGNNGTKDLRDYFVILSTVGNAGNQHDELNRIKVTASLCEIPWEHSHAAGTQYARSGWGYEHTTYSATHSHTSVTAWQDYVPPYYALTFIEKA